MKKLLIATTNPAKFDEYTEFLKDLPLQLLSLKEAGITQIAPENGATFEENATVKALFYNRLSNLPTIADDGGLTATDQVVLTIEQNLPPMASMQ